MLKSKEKRSSAGEGTEESARGGERSGRTVPAKTGPSKQEPASAGASAGNGAPQSLVAALRQSWGNETTIKAGLGPERKRKLAQIRSVAAEARSKLGNFSAHPAARREHPLFIARTATAARREEIVRNAFKVGLNRLGDYKGGLNLRTLGPELGQAAREGKMSIKDFMGILARKGLGGDLQRSRTLDDLARGLVAATDSRADTGGEPPAASQAGTAAPVPADVSPESANSLILDRLVGQLQNLEAASQAKIEQRPDAGGVNKAVEALELTGGPADVAAFHDFKVLQMAFRDVWTELIDKDLEAAAAGLYVLAVKHYEEMDGAVPPVDAITDVATLNEFISQIRSELGLGAQPAVDPAVVSAMASAAAKMTSAVTFSTTAGDLVSGAVYLAAAQYEIPAGVMTAFPFVTTGIWNMLSDGQRLVVQQQAVLYNAGAPRQQGQATTVVNYLLSHPEGSAGKLAALIMELGRMMTERYSFDVFAPDTCNYGILLTYRQNWEPQAYQVGNLVSSVPLAPGETRKYSKKVVQKQSYSEKRADSASSSRTGETSELARAETEIMRKTASATNFKMSSEGRFSMEMVQVGVSSEFGTDQKQDSVDSKKNFHEATTKSAEEYKKNRSLEVDTSSSTETEQSTSGEISNPNNEITVTYLFYELQRRYRISEQLHRAQSVIMVAQDVPAPHEITEAWLIAHQWILAHFLLDESFRPALQYLSSGFAGDEVAIEVLRAQWQAQKDVLGKMEKLADDQLSMRDALRDALLRITETKEVAQASGKDTGQQIADAIFTGGWSIVRGDDKNLPAETAEAQRRSAETRLQYADEALSDAQKKLAGAANAFESATRAYAAALQQRYARRIAIEQLRVHVKQNILYYMQGLWDSEPPDQRFFRLYNKKVLFPDADPNAQVSVYPSGYIATGEIPGKDLKHLVSVNLVEIADLDKPLGYKGNYIIFPLKKPCYMTAFMLQSFYDDYFGIQDPDAEGNWPVSEVRRYAAAIGSARPPVSHDAGGQPAAEVLKGLADLHRTILDNPRTVTDEIIVPTGELYIEALPGRHPLLEDFKLRHRMEDLRKTQAEVRHAEMENLRLAARLVAGEREDPEIAKRIMVDEGIPVTVNPDS